MPHSKFVVVAATLALSVTALFSDRSQAAVLEYEGFDYAADGSSLAGKNGGTGWGTNVWVNAAGDVTLAASGGSLSYPSNVLTTAGTRVEQSAAVTSTIATRALGTTMSLLTTDIPAPGTAFYSSGLFQASATTGERTIIRFSDNTSGGGNLRWSYGIDALGQFIVTLDPNATTTQVATSTATITPGTTYFLISKYRPNTAAGGNDEVFLKWFGPDDTVAEPTSDAGWDLRVSGNSGVVLRSVSLVGDNASGQARQFDELRIGETFADVAGVPEPGSLALFGLAAAASLARRPVRRRV